MKKLSILFCFLFSVSYIYSQSNDISTYNIPPEKPKLIVGIVIDQMRQDYLERFWNNFDKNGFKKLAINGSYCKNANYNYSQTQSSPGYVTIVTGAEPSEHGIVSDYWYNPLTGNKEYCVQDHQYKVVGDKDAIGKYSPRNMLSTTFSDEVKLFNNGKSKIISISLNENGAILSGGFSANAAYWFDEKSGNWITSSYYMEKLPNWVNEVNHKKMPNEYLTREWKPMLDFQEYNNFSSDSLDIKYKYGIDGSYKKFPYNYSEIKKTIKNYELIKFIPEGNTLLNDMAVAALYNENLGERNITDFLLINYSVSENIGKLFGPQSIELEDLFLRLDKDLAHLISVIEEKVGKNNVLIYLTSNHGVAEVPAILAKNKIPAEIYKKHYIIALLNSYLKAIYGEGNWILDFSNNQIYLNKTLIEDSRISLSEFQEKVIAFIINSNGLTNAISSHQFQNIVFNHGMPQKMQNSYNQKRSGDIMYSLKSGWIEDCSFATNHNSGYSYDTHVLLIWYGWKTKKQTLFSNINITDIAPTISMILNTPDTPVSSGRKLEEVFNIR